MAGHVDLLLAWLLSIVTTVLKYHKVRMSTKGILPNSYIIHDPYNNDGHDNRSIYNPINSDDDDGWLRNISDNSTIRLLLGPGRCVTKFPFLSASRTNSNAITRPRRRISALIAEGGAIQHCQWPAHIQSGIE